MYNDKITVFLKNIAHTIVKSFSGYNIFWHILAASSTYILAVSGFDWFWYRTMNHYFVFLIPSALIGFFVPIILPLGMYAWAKIKKNSETLKKAFLIGEAELAALLVSDFYKALTGRAHPDVSFMGSLTNLTTDITRVFHFGFFKGGIFWGWPSSHTIVAFSLAATLCCIYKDKKWVQVLAILMAIYIGVGISGTIHWFSDFTAGAILGTLVGYTAAHAEQLLPAT